MTLSDRYRYGDAGDRYPVAFGDIWRVGPHIAACGDIEAGNHLQVLSMANRIGMVYMDPPWDPANITLFRSKAGKERGVALEDFLKRLVTSLSVCEGDIYLEMGARWLQRLKDTLSSSGATVSDEWQIFYYGTKPCHLVRASYREPVAISGSPKGMDDEDTPTWAIEASSKPGDIIVDLCCGQGGTPTAAAATGRVFLGMELNPRRLAVTLDKLQKMGEGTPEKIGTLT